MQILYPENDSFIGSLLAIFVALLALLGFIFVLYAYLLGKSEDKKVKNQYLFGILGSILLAFVIYNLVNYFFIYDKKNQGMSGKKPIEKSAQINTSQDYFL